MNKNSTNVALNDLKNQILDGAASGRGLVSLLELAYRRYQTGIALCDNSFSCIARYPATSSDTIFIFEKDKGFMRKELLDDFYKWGIPQKLLSQPSEPFLAQFQNTQTFFLYCGIHARSTILGYLCIQYKSPVLSDADADFTRFLSQILSLELQKETFSPSLLSYQEEAVFLDFIEQRLTHIPYLLERFPQFKKRQGAPMRIAILFFASGGRPLKPNAGLSQQLKAVLPDCLLCQRLNEMILLFFPDEAMGFSPTQSIKVRHFLQANHLLLACGNPVFDLCQLPLSFSQASLLRLRLRSEFSNDPCLFLEDFLPKCLFFANIQKDEAISWLHPHVILLLRHDRSYKTSYIPTLKAYFSCNRNAQAASDALHIHKTTFFYRIRSMEALVGEFMKRPELLFLYQYSLYLLDHICTD